MMNKSKGNMHGFVTHTWNPIKGKCPHECSYCYMNKMYKRYGSWLKRFRLDEKCLKDNLGKGNYIFVGSSTDMWCDESKGEWIEQVLEYCKQFPENQYFFQSKNPERFIYYSDRGKFPHKSILCTTIETNNQKNLDKYSKAPDLGSRKYGMICSSHRTMITIEPIMDFDRYLLRNLIWDIKPIQVNIGADSGHNNLSEPPKEKIEELITELKKFTTVHQKENLKRLLR